MLDTVTISVNNQDFQGWKSVRLEAGIERIARSFEVSVTEYWPGSDKARKIKPGDLCEVKIGDDVVCTGYVDATPIDYDADGITIIVRGRSKTADLVDCSADNPTGQFKGLTVDGIAKKIAAQHGVSVVVEAATGTVLTDHQVQQGESAFESLDRLAKQRQVLMSDNGAGDLVLLSPGSSGNASSKLDLGVNILSASAGFDYSEVYSEYSVKGQSSKQGQDGDWDGNSAANLAGAKGHSRDSSVKRRRILIVRQSGQADAGNCQRRANYEQRVRAAKAQEVRYKVVGWRQQDGTLWQPNMTVAIKDDIMGLDTSLLISEVLWTLDEGGMITELVCLPKDAFLSEPEAQASKSAYKSGSSNIGGDWNA